MFSKRLAASAFLLSIGVVSNPRASSAQGMDDMPLTSRHTLDFGLVYSSDSWDHYWEGSLKRTNANIGTLSTRSVSLVAAYGFNERLDITAMLPYVRTMASQGTLHEMRGFQDFRLSARYRLLTTSFTQHARVSAIVGAAAGVPASNYTPDYLPLSIGSASQQYSARFALHAQSDSWWFANASTGYTWRRNVRLDRSAYYTQGQLYLTNEVAMPDIADYAVSAGYRVGRLCIPLVLAQQRTLGGGDIRRQDMPFVSNRMDFVKVGGSLLYNMPVPNHLTIQLGAMRTVSGRNVGQSQAFTVGAMYAVHR